MVDETIKEPTDTATGTMEDMRTNAVDPLASVDATLGHKPFLSWTLTRDSLDRPVYVAYGVSDKVYIITSDMTPPASTTGVTAVGDREV